MYQGGEETSETSRLPGGTWKSASHRGVTPNDVNRVFVCRCVLLERTRVDASRFSAGALALSLAGRLFGRSCFDAPLRELYGLGNARAPGSGHLF